MIEDSSTTFDLQSDKENPQHTVFVVITARESANYDRVISPNGDVVVGMHLVKGPDGAVDYIPADVYRMEEVKQITTLYSEEALEDIEFVGVRADDYELPEAGDGGGGFMTLSEVLERAGASGGGRQPSDGGLFGGGVDVARGGGHDGGRDDGGSGGTTIEFGDGEDDEEEDAAGDVMTDGGSPLDAETPHKPVARQRAELFEDLDSLQRQVGEWSVENFGDQPATYPLLGVGEELGELHHAVLKDLQGIREDEEGVGHEAELDAVGDIIVYLADFCHRRGLHLGDAVDTAWYGEVVEREWDSDVMIEDAAGGDD